MKKKNEGCKYLKVTQIAEKIKLDRPNKEKGLFSLVLYMCIFFGGI